MSKTDETESWGTVCLQTVLALFALTIFAAFVIFVCLPVYLFRLLAYLAARLIRPDLDRMLTPQSNIMATDAIYTKPEGTYVTKFLLDGEIGRKELESRLQVAICNEKFSVLSQTLENWMGFYFWKRFDENKPFQLNDQLEFNEDQVSTDEIKDIHKSLVDRPFKKNQPLWECIVYTNVLPEKIIRNVTRQTVIFFRVHQSLADGTSFFSIFDELKMVPEHQVMLNLFMGNQNSIMSLKEKVKFGLRVLGLGPFYMAWDWAHARVSQSDNNKMLRTLMNKLESNTETKVIEEVYLENARRIAMSNMAPTGALSVSIVTGIVRRIADCDGQEDLKVTNVPNLFKINCPMPIPFPADRISNYVALIPIAGETATTQPIARLGAMLQSIGDMIFSTTPYITFGLVLLIGGLNSYLTKYFARLLPLGSVILNIFPGSTLRRKFLEKDVSAITVQSGCPSFLGGACCNFNSIMYKGELSVSMTCPKNLNVKDKLLEEFKLCQASANSNAGFFGMNLGNLLNALT